MYDIVFLGPKNKNWDNLKKRFPTAKHADTFDKIKSKVFTKFFWLVPNDVVVAHDFELEFTPDEWSKEFVHVFKNGEHNDGLALFPKRYKATTEELNTRVYTNVKYVDTIASYPSYDKFKIETYDQYQEALSQTTTEMFWALKDVNDLTIEGSHFGIAHYSRSDRVQNHAFKNKTPDGYDKEGAYLCSIHAPLTQNEVEYRSPYNRREWDIVASTYTRYDIFVIDTYEDYQYALDTATTDMFWASSNNISITDESVFDVIFYKRHFHDTENEYNLTHNHAFIHRVDDTDYYNGLFLFSKKLPVSKKEIDYRFVVNSTQWDIVASGKTIYDKFEINNYNDYLNALEKSKTELFWAVNKQINIDSNFKFDLYFTHDNEYDRKQNHVFQHVCNSELKYTGGVALLSKHKTISEKEVNFKHIINSKMHEVVASEHKPYDVVFISYDEPNANENYEELLKKVPYAKRIDKVKGIHQAHIEAAKICNSDLFYVVDGDAKILDSFSFDYYAEPWEKEAVHVWRSLNPINDLEYGYGGVKLLPTQLTIDMDLSKADMSTSISSKFKVMSTISNITAFNTDEFNTWKSAFRESAKLASKTIQGQVDEETEERLRIWTSVGIERRFGEYAIRGAIQGREFGYLCRNDPIQLFYINDYDWLYNMFLNHDQKQEQYVQLST